MINTLLLHIPLLALTQPQMELQRNKLILVGLGNLWFLQVKRQKCWCAACKLTLIACEILKMAIEDDGMMNAGMGDLEWQNG